MAQIGKIGRKLCEHMLPAGRKHIGHMLPRMLQMVLAMLFAKTSMFLCDRKHEKKPPAVTGLDIAVLDTWAAQQQGKGSPLEGIGAFGAGTSNIFQHPLRFCCCALTLLQSCCDLC